MTSLSSEIQFQEEVPFLSLEAEPRSSYLCVQVYFYFTFLKVHLHIDVTTSKEFPASLVSPEFVPLENKAIDDQGAACNFKLFLSKSKNF